MDIDAPFPLTFTEQYALTEATAELATSCYAGVLMLQAMGLGGWMFDGIDRFSVLGASGNPDVPGLGFRYDQDERWAVPNPTGLPGVFEAFCPPHHADMTAAVEAFAERKFGAGGSVQPGTPGAWTDSPGFRGSAQVHDEEFKACVALQAQYILDTFGKFPGTVPDPLHPQLRPGPPPGPGVLRPLLRARRLPALARRPHGAVARLRGDLGWVPTFEPAIWTSGPSRWARTRRPADRRRRRQRRGGSTSSTGWPTATA